MATRTPPEPREVPLGERWRAQVQAAQQDALPVGAVTVSCPAPFGIGGLGRHMQEIVDALDRLGQSHYCVCESRDRDVCVSAPRKQGHGDAAPRELRGGGLRRPDPWRLLATGRFSPARRLWAHCVRFDRRAARRLPAAEHLIAFNGAALAQLHMARSSGYDSVAVVSATAHLAHVLRQQEQACRRYPLERPWASLLVRRSLAEYARADRVYVSSSYIRDSFLAEGMSGESLSLFPLTPDRRFTPAEKPREQSVFTVVYVGGLTVDKGVPVLLEAVRVLPHSDLRLILVGGWKSRGMRRFIQRRCAEDTRVTVSLGDPLAHLREASLYVHAAYSDGFGYAPAEALACGVPVIVSEHTGMKELISPGGNGLIVPTGDARALAQAISSAYAGDAFRPAAVR